MPVQLAARKILQGIRQRSQAANATGVLTSREQILAARKLPLPALRQLAKDQITKATEALSQASGVALDIEHGWNFIPAVFVVTKLADHYRWQPAGKLLEEAQAAFERGEKAAADSDKQGHYLSAWTTARQAVAAVEKESGQGKTDFLVEAGASADEVVDAAKEAAGKITQGAKDAAHEAFDWVKVALGVGAGFLILKAVSR